MRALRYRRGINGQRVGFGPLRDAVFHFQTIHSDFEFTSPDLDQDVVVIDLLALERIISGAPYRISVGAAAAGYKVSNSAALVPFIVMHMTGEHDNSRVPRFLLFFQISRKFLFRRTCAASAAAVGLVAGTRNGRVM